MLIIFKLFKNRTVKAGKKCIFIRVPVRAKVIHVMSVPTYVMYLMDVWIIDLRQCKKVLCRGVSKSLNKNTLLTFR
jgi:hypothetical protein